MTDRRTARQDGTRPAFASLLAVNGHHASRRRERALVNDLTSVVQSCLIVFVAATISIPIAAVFVLLLVRAAVLPRYPLTPKQVGIAEIVAPTLVLSTAVAAG